MLARLYKWFQQTEVYLSHFKKRDSTVRFEGACKMRGACCQNLILVDRGRPIVTIKGFERLVRRKPFHQMFVPREEPDTEGILRFSCRNLTTEHRCGIYETRPDMCRTYPEPRMIELGGELLPGCGFTVVKPNFEQHFRAQLDGLDTE